MIKATDFIEMAFSIDDATKIENAISPLINNDEKVIVDFDGITIFTTLFFNNAFAKYVLKFGPEKYQKIFDLRNLTELGAATYKHSFDNAVNYYSLSEEQKRIHDETVENIEG